MNIKPYKKSDGKTYYKFRIYQGIDPLTGKEIRIRRQGFKSKQEAQIEYAKLMIGIDTKNKDHTFQEVYEIWKPTYRNRVKESTYKQTMNLFNNHILSTFKDLEMDKITIDYIQAYVDLKAPKLQKTRTILGYISSIFEIAQARGIVESNPCDGVIFPTNLEKKSKKKDNYWTKDELNQFLKALEKEDIKWHALLRLLAITGMRRGEVLALEWTDLEDSIISITKTRARGTSGDITQDTPKTEKSNRTIYIDPKTEKLLMEWKKTQTSLMGFTKIMFTNTKGNYIRLTHPIKRLHAIIKKNDLKSITLHGLRHTHTTLLVKSGVPIDEIMDRLGHEDIQTTIGIYNHISNDNKKRATNKVINFLD